MNKKLLTGAIFMSLLVACNKDKDVLNALAEYNTSMESQGYHFGDALKLPDEVTKNSESVTISFGDKQTDKLVVDPQYFNLGDNAVTFNIKKKNGEMLHQDATINVYAKSPEVKLKYTLVKEYPHSTENFTEGIFVEGNTVYESVGLEGKSKLMKYALGSSNNSNEAVQPAEIFSEGIAAVDNKIYQLTYRAKKGFIYDKNSLKLIGEFPYPNVMGEGWGLTYDGKNLVATDGTKNIYFLDPNDPSKLVRYISVAGNNQVYDQLNELEFHNGFIYSNVWQKPIILKIDPKTGEVVGKFDFSEFAKQNTKGTDDVLNGIAFNGDNMLITGKNWPKIYEVSISK